MKKYILGILGVCFSFVIGCATNQKLGIAVQHNSFTNTNTYHGLHVDCFQGTFAGMAAVTTQWAGDCYQVVGDPNPSLNGQHYEYISSIPAPTPAFGTGIWNPIQFGVFPTSTWTFTATWTITQTPTPTFTQTPTPTGSFTPTNTKSSTPTPTGANTATNTPTVTPTYTFTPTFTPANTYTPVPGSDVIIDGYDIDGMATGITIVGNRIQVTGITGPVPGDYVAFQGLLPASANTLWQVVSATTNYFECLTNQSGITNGGSADSVFDLRGNRSKNTQLISSISASGGPVSFYFVNNQPDIYYGVEFGSISNGLTILPFNTVLANNYFVITPYGLNTGNHPVTLKLEAATTYFFVKLSGIQ